MFGDNDTPAKPPSRRRVLKPPGGGSSDIFGSSHEPEPQQRKVKNHLTSSIFGGEESQTPARKPGNDSFYNLFGAEPQSQSRPGTAMKDKFKSNIVLNDMETDAKKSLVFSDGGKTETDNGVEMERESGSEQEMNSVHTTEAVETNGVHKTEIESNGVHKNGLEDGEKEVNQQAATNGEKAEPAVNGSSSASSTASTPASAPSAPSVAPASKQRVPPGGFSSGLW